MPAHNTHAKCSDMPFQAYHPRLPDAAFCWSASPYSKAQHNQTWRLLSALVLPGRTGDLLENSQTQRNERCLHNEQDMNMHLYDASNSQVASNRHMGQAVHQQCDRCVGHPLISFAWPAESRIHSRTHAKARLPPACLDNYAPISALSFCTSTSTLEVPASTTSGVRGHCSVLVGISPRVPPQLALWP